MNMNNFDTVILGGGLAGLTLAIQLKQRMADHSVAVVERHSHPVKEATHKVGESTLELAAFYFSRVLGLREHMENSHLPKLGLRLFFDTNENTGEPNLNMQDYLEMGNRAFPPNRTFQIDRGIFENYLAKECQKLGVVFMDGTKIRDVDLADSNSSLHQVHCQNINTKESTTLNCKWVVDASSRFAILKRKLGLKQDNEHKVSSAWFRIGEKIDVTEWSSCKEWQSQNCGETSRWYSTNHFMGEGFWIWVLPLSSGSTSIGIVADSNYHPLENYNTIEKAMAWFEKNSPVCAENLKRHLDKLQDFRVLRNFSHDCKQVFSTDRWFITGEAGAFLDPLYSPGSDMIAVSNTLVTNLIEADYKSKEMGELTPFLNDFYLRIHSQTLVSYKDKYQLFGNPVVTLTKLFWDSVFYAALTAFVFNQGKFSCVDKLMELQQFYEAMFKMNREMQEFFVVWNECESSHILEKGEHAYIDFGELPLIIDLYSRLFSEMADEAFMRRLERNVERQKVLYNEIIDAALVINPELSETVASSSKSVETPHSDVKELLNQIAQKEIFTVA